MKKLYRVDVTVELVVAADSAAEAEREAEYIVRVEDGGAEAIAIATPLEETHCLPHEWDAGTIPFCSEGDKTIGDYLAGVNPRHLSLRPVTSGPTQEKP